MLRLNLFASDLQNWVTLLLHQMCKFLLACGANKNFRNQNGQSAAEFQFWRVNKTKIETDSTQKNDLWARGDLNCCNNLIFAIKQNILIETKLIFTKNLQLEFANFNKLMIPIFETAFCQQQHKLWPRTSCNCWKFPYCCYSQA